jgi:hypothetical protein
VSLPQQIILAYLQTYAVEYEKFSSMQSEGIEVSSEMEFLTQQNIMLDLENKALKQRLESLAQEQLIKRCKYVRQFCFYYFAALFSTQKIMPRLNCIL